MAGTAQRAGGGGPPRSPPSAAAAGPGLAPQGRALGVPAWHRARPSEASTTPAYPGRQASHAGRRAGGPGSRLWQASLPGVAGWVLGLRLVAPATQTPHARHWWQATAPGPGHRGRAAGGQPPVACMGGSGGRCYEQAVPAAGVADALQAVAHPARGAGCGGGVGHCLQRPLASRCWERVPQASCPARYAGRAAACGAGAAAASWSPPTTSSARGACWWRQRRGSCGRGRTLRLRAPRGAAPATRGATPPAPSALPCGAGCVAVAAVPACSVGLRPAA